MALTSERRGRVLVVDDEAAVRESLSRVFDREGYWVITAEDGDRALELVRSEEVDVALVDLKLPRMDGVEFLRAARAGGLDVEVVLMTAHGTVEAAVEAMKEGAHDFVLKPFKRETILRAVARALDRRTLAVEKHGLGQRPEEMEGPAVVGTSAVMRRVLEAAQRVAASSATVLLTGESGTGKDVVAQVIHQASPRRNRPFLKVSCAAIPETLLEAELFGHERGAFTGAAARREGRFEMANGGTLLLDEVAEIPAAMQVKLLRVLQDGEFERLGESRPTRVDVRVVAATNRDLAQAVRERQFREDLFYRLNVVSIYVPPLRNRREDIPLLVDHFIRLYRERNRREIRGISRQALRVLQDYSWPGNVRELEKTLESAIVLSTGQVLTVEDLPREITQEATPRREIVVPVGTRLDDAERQLIHETLALTRGDKRRAARLLGVSVRTIYRRLAETRWDGRELSGDLSLPGGAEQAS